MAQIIAKDYMKLSIHQKLSVSIISVLFALSMSGCSVVSGAFEGMQNIVGLGEKGTVIVYRAQVRSSFAVVAADLLEVKRGQTMDILEEEDFEKVKWYRVRVHDEDNTEGWIEAQNIIVGSLLEKSKKLAEEDKNLQSQATGELRAPTNLRLSPEQKDDNILFKLEKKSDSETTFDIVGWKYVPRQASPDEANKPGGQGKKNEEVESAKDENHVESLDEAYDIWYRVRLDPSVSPAPAGWIFGRQVELRVPSDIVFYQTGLRKFVTWQRLDDIEEEKPTSKDMPKISKPGSWVILMRSNEVKAKGGVEPDFDGILVLAYDKFNEEHYTIYRNEEVWGNIPLRVDGIGDNKSFYVNIKNAAGALEEKRFSVVKDQKGHLKVIPPPDMVKEKKDDK